MLKKAITLFVAATVSAGAMAGGIPADSKSQTAPVKRTTRTKTTTRKTTSTTPALKPELETVRYFNTFRSAQMLPVDSRYIYDYETDSFLPYGYYRVNTLVSYPKAVAGIALEQIEAFNTALAEKLYDKQATSPAEAARAFANTSVITDFEGETTAVVPDPNCKVSGIGVSTTFKFAYPETATSKFIQWTLIDGLDTGSGTSAGLMSGEDYMVLMKEPTDWCPTGILTYKEMFNGGTPSKKLIPVLNRQLNIEARNQDNCLTPGSVERVPTTVCLTSKGIEFVFGKYEVGCGAAGNYHLLISWTKLAPYLNPQFLAWVKSATGWKNIKAPNDLWD